MLSETHEGNLHPPETLRHRIQRHFRWLWKEDLGDAENGREMATVANQTHTSIVIIRVPLLCCSYTSHNLLTLIIYPAIGDPSASCALLGGSSSLCNSAQSGQKNGSAKNGEKNILYNLMHQKKGQRWAEGCTQRVWHTQGLEERFPIKNPLPSLSQVIPKIVARL